MPHLDKKYVENQSVTGCIYIFSRVTDVTTKYSPLPIAVAVAQFQSHSLFWSNMYLHNNETYICTKYVDLMYVFSMPNSPIVVYIIRNTYWVPVSLSNISFSFEFQRTRLHVNTFFWKELKVSNYASRFTASLSELEI